jgi:UDP-glucose 4-epimerase
LLTRAVLELKRILITGGAGFIGRHLLRSLLAAGYSVSVLDNLHRSQAIEFADFIHGDIRDAATVQRACIGVDTVFHLAAESRVLPAEQNAAYCHSINVEGTAVLLKACRASGVRRLVFASSREVYGIAASLPVSEEAPCNPQNVYGQSKLLGEQLCRTFPEVEVVILRLANIYGPGDQGRVIPRFVQSAIAGQPLTVIGNGKLLDFLWIEDAVAAMILAAELAPAASVFNIGSGRGVEVLSVAQRLVKLSGKHSKITTCPGNPLEVPSYIADIRRAQTVLGFAPSLNSFYGFEQMVAEARAALNDSGEDRFCQAIAPGSGLIGAIGVLY